MRLSRPTGTNHPRISLKKMRMAKELVPTDEDDFGPALRACNARERAFVTELFDPAGCSRAEAAKRSGYGNADGTSTPATLAKIGYRLARSPRVQAAIAELIPGMATALGPLALRAVSDTLLNSAHPQRLKAGLSIIERIAPTVQRIDANVRHEIVDHRQDAFEQIKALLAMKTPRDEIEKSYGYTALADAEAKLAREANKPITVEYEEIPNVEDL